MQSDGTIVELPDALKKQLRDEIKGGGDPDLVEIPAAQLEQLRAMNRHDRRAWYARERKQRRKRARRAAPAETE